MSNVRRVRTAPQTLDLGLWTWDIRPNLPLSCSLALLFSCSKKELFLLNAALEHDTPSTTPPPSAAWRMLSLRPDNLKLIKGLDAGWHAIVGRCQPMMLRRKRFLRRAEHILKLETKFDHLSDAALAEIAVMIGRVFRLGRESELDVDQAFALVREVAHRKVGLKPHMVQVAAALAMDAGCVAELATGEGKTLVATMPAALAGWRGRGCHIITVNDYLAERDAQTMAPVYEFCGLTVAHVSAEMQSSQRRTAYQADVTYVTNKEVAADFLRDRLALGRIKGLTPALVKNITDRHGGARGGTTEQLVQRGLAAAIVDEADSVLIDEAVTPLIIADESDSDEVNDGYVKAAALADELQEGTDYEVDHRYREINLTGTGRHRIAELTQRMAGFWSVTRRREELVSQALSSRHLFLRDKQYVIQDDKLVLIDEFTGRLMPDRSWRTGIQQAVEVKEHLAVSPMRETLARVSFQRFFRLYPRLSGMTGTAAEAKAELWQIYRLPTVCIPTHRPCLRTHEPDRIFASVDAKWKAVVNEIRNTHERGRPVLSGASGPSFNVSHTEGLVACAVSSGAVGVDVERGRRLRDPRALATRFFHPDEAAEILETADASAARKGFLRLWTLKEAYAKALGHGVAGYLGRVRFPSDEGRLVPRDQTADDGGGPTESGAADAGWTCWHRNPTTAHHLAVVAAGGTRLCCHWLDATGRPRGLLVYRWVWARNSPTPIARVVNISEVAEMLPEDHPRVDAAGRRAGLARRRTEAWNRFQ